MNFMTNENWINYALLNSDSIPYLLLELEKETYQKVLHPRMLSGPLQGRLLSLFSKNKGTSSTTAFVFLFFLRNSVILLLTIGLFLIIRPLLNRKLT